VGVGGRSEDNVGGDQSWVEDLVEEREQQQQQQRQRRPSEGMGEPWSAKRREISHCLVDHTCERRRGPKLLSGR
jgi:hypothetical protein